MSQYTIKINTPSYLGQWLRHECYNEATRRVEFPKGSAERNILELFLTKPPKVREDVTAEVDENIVTIEVPTFYGKNPDQHCHLPKKATAALLSTIKKRFKKMLWDEMHVIQQKDVQMTDMIYAFMEKHGIDDNERNFLAIRQIYFRIRDSYKKKENKC